MANVILSFVVPVYNTERYLKECVDSIVSQQGNYEIILVNDGSTDNSLKICNEYKDKYPVVKVINQENGGLSVARNSGINFATGDYLVFVDSDDYVNENCVVAIEKAIEKYDYPDILIGTQIISIFENAQNYYHDSKVESFFGEKTINKKTAIEWVFEKSDYASLAQRFIVKRQFVIDNKLSFEPNHLHEDVAWVPILFASAKSFGILSDYWYNYRRGRVGSIMTNIKEKNIVDMINLIEICIHNKSVRALHRCEYVCITSRLAATLCCTLNSAYNMPKDSLEKIASLLECKPFLFSNVKKIQHKVFYTFAKIFGFKYALRFLSIISKFKG